MARGQTTDQALDQAPDADIPLFTHTSLPEPPYGRFVKRHVTEAVRIAGPFKVRTSEGTMECADGWLALDSGGSPYPISAEEFARIYEPLNTEAVVGVDRSEWTEEDREASSRAWRIGELREAFARAILQNPSVERFVYGNPLERRRVMDYPTIGAYLAHECDRLAEEYYAAAQPLDLARMPTRAAAPDDSANVATTE